MSRVYIYLLAIATVTVSVTAVFFSVTGLAELFAGAPRSVVAMATSLELSKFVLVGVLYRYWGHIHKPLKAYLCFAVATLMVITSAGVYGYLSNAYHIASHELHAKLMKIESLEHENERVRGQILEDQKFVESIPASRISRKFEFQKQYEPKIAELREKSETLVHQIEEAKLDLLTTNTKIGPAVHLAKFLGVDIDTAVNWLIMIFVLVFDPLAVAMVFCLNLLIRLREKYRGNEYKIGAHSLTSPVDHRYKKSA